MTVTSCGHVAEFCWVRQYLKYFLVMKCYVNIYTFMFELDKEWWTRIKISFGDMIAVKNLSVTSVMNPVIHPNLFSLHFSAQLTSSSASQSHLSPTAAPAETALARDLGNFVTLGSFLNLVRFIYFLSSVYFILSVLWAPSSRRRK